MKKVLVVLLALVMVFGCFTFASATQFSDIADTDYAEAIQVMAGLGVMHGDDDDAEVTTFRPNGTLTRAEACAVICRLLGYEDWAKTPTATIYSDCTSLHWGSGYVQYATGLGIVEGDGNGLFRPNDPVTKNEWLTMIMRAEGYKDAKLVGSWPTNFVIKATQKGLVSSTALMGNEAATRGEMAQVTYENLEKARVGYNATTGEEVPVETAGVKNFLSILGCTAGEPSLIDYDETDELLQNYVGHYGVAYYKKGSNDAIAFADQSVVLTGKFVKATKTTELTFAGYKFVDGAKNSNKTVADDDVIVITNTNPADGKALSWGTSATYTLTCSMVNGEIAAITASEVWSVDANKQVGSAEPAAITKAIAKAKAEGTASEIALKVGSTEYLFAAEDGVLIDDTVANLAKNDIVSFYLYGDTNKVVKLVVCKDTIHGTVGSKTYNSSLKDYVYTINGTAYTTAKDSTVDSDALAVTKDAPVGTYYLNEDGELVAFEADPDVEGTKYAVVLQQAQPATGGDGDIYAAADYEEAQIYLLTADGTKAVYKVNKYYNGDDASKQPKKPIALTGSSFSVGAIVTYELNEDGELIAIEAVDSEVIEEANLTYNAAAGILNNRLLSSDAFIVKANPGLDKDTVPYVATTVNAIPGKYDTQVSESTIVFNSKGVVEVVFLGTVTAAEDDTEYVGFFTADYSTATLDEDGLPINTVSALINGEAQVLTADEFNNIAQGNDKIYTFTFKANGDVDTVTSKDITYQAVKAVSGNNVSVGNDGYQNIAADAIVYVAQYKADGTTFKSWEVAGIEVLADLTTDDNIALFNVNKASTDTYDYNVVIVK